MRLEAGDDSAHVVTQMAAAKELIRNTIAVDMIDIAKQMGKTSGGCQELQ